MTTPRQRVTFVTYGGGHVRMLAPVIERMRHRPELDLAVVALTTARRHLDTLGIDSLGFADLANDGDERALDIGRKLGHEFESAPIDADETAAYLGLSYVDLVERVGEAEAARRYGEQGRRAFLPVGVMRRFFERTRPDLVVTTSSPRAEQAAIVAARELSIASVCALDLFGLGEPWIVEPGYADRICVASEYVRDGLVARGRAPHEVVVTGNPAFDYLAVAAGPCSVSRWRAARGWDDGPVVLWVSQPMPPAHPVSGAPVDPEFAHIVRDRLIDAIDRRPGWRLVVRPHPNEVVGYGDLPDGVDLSGPDDDLVSLLHSVDVAVVISSTLGFEAALCGTRLVVVDSPFAGDAPYHEMGLAAFASDLGALGSTLDDVISGRWQPTGELPHPGGAADKVCSVLDEMLDRAAR